ncbi:hypothetical protein BH11PSE5_BH11PSE5_27680 [soil metagenome]
MIPKVERNLTFADRRSAFQSVVRKFVDGQTDHGNDRFGALHRRAFALGVCGVDISAALVKEAARRASDAGVRNVPFEAGDATALKPEGAPFDRLMSRLGITFFVDPATAFQNLHCLMAKGGTAGTVVWAPPQDNVWIGGELVIVAAHIAKPRPTRWRPGHFPWRTRSASLSCSSRQAFPKSHSRRGRDR